MNSQAPAGAAPSLEHLLASARALPTLPQVVRYILETIDDENASADTLVQHLNTDPAIVARLLAAANSSAFGLASKVASTRQAIIVLGVTTVRKITLATALIDRFAGVGSEGRLIWRHSLAVATCARSLAERCESNPEAAFSAGLLHDIGQLLMAAVAPLAGKRVRELALSEEIPTLEAENRIFGYDHSEAGAALAGLWQLPAELIGAISGHHRPEDGEHGQIADLIHVAEVLSHALDLGAEASNRVPEVAEIALSRLGVDWAGLAADFPAIEARYRGACQALGM